MLGIELRDYLLKGCRLDVLIEVYPVFLLLALRIPQKLRILGSMVVILVAFLVTAIFVKVDMAPLPFFSVTMIKIIIINCELLNFNANLTAVINNRLSDPQPDALKTPDIIQLLHQSADDVVVEGWGGVAQSQESFIQPALRRGRALSRGKVSFLCFTCLFFEIEIQPISSKHQQYPQWAHRDRGCGFLSLTDLHRVDLNPPLMSGFFYVKIEPANERREPASDNPCCCQEEVERSLSAPPVGLKSVEHFPTRPPAHPPSNSLFILWSSVLVWSISYYYYLMWDTEVSLQED